MADVELTTDVTTNGETIDFTVYEDIDNTGSVDNQESVNGVANGTNTYTLSTLTGGGGNAYYFDTSLSTADVTTSPTVHSASLSVPVTPPAPSNVSLAYDADDQVTLTWDAPSDTSNLDHYDVEISRDDGTWLSPSGGPVEVTEDGSASYSVTYGPSSDTAYGKQVGIDSSFDFRVASSSSGGDVSSFVTSNTVYTTPIPPHNPSVSRPDANTFELSWTQQTDIPDYVSIYARKDTGGGYGSWTFVQNIDPVNGSIYGTSDVTSNGSGGKGGTSTTTISVGDNTQGTDSTYFVEDARYQFRINPTRRDNPSGDLDGDTVYADYGNEGNVYFEDDFESNDLSKWRNTPGAYTSSGAGMDSGFDSADQGTYYCILDGESKIDVRVGDLTNESDVIVKAAIGVGSADHDGEEMAVDFWDGDNWQQLTDFHWEYNKQGWVEMTALVPDSYLNNDSHIRFESESGGGGDHYYIDRVVVSDILHEYTQPADPSGLSLDTSVVHEITASWTRNSSVGTRWEDTDYKKTSATTWTGPWSSSTSETFTGLEDDEEYEVRLQSIVQQDRQGTGGTNYWRGNWITPVSAVTALSAVRTVNSHSSTVTSFTDDPDIDVTVLPESHTGLVTSGSEAFTEVSRGTTSAAQRIEVVSDRILSLPRGPVSSTSPLTAHSLRVSDYVRPSNSHTSMLSNTAIRTIGVSRNTESESYEITSNSIRIADYDRPINSHTRPMRMWPQTERTSLELIDFQVDWDDDESAWYTNWFQEKRILGSEDGIAIMANVVEDAKDPSARIQLQYDANGDGRVDRKSDHVELHSTDNVKPIEGIPMDEDGYYRLKVDDYSGYNSLLSLDVGFTH